MDKTKILDGGKINSTNLTRNSKQKIKIEVVAINAAETGDPGEKSEGKIFSISCKKDGEDGLYDILNKYPSYHCQKSFKVKTVSNLSEYIDTRGSYNEYRKSNSLDVHGGYGVNLEASVAFETSGSSEYEGIKKLLEEKQGEITIARAKCYLDVVNLKEGYRPKYDRGFIRFLELINDTKDR